MRSEERQCECQCNSRSLEPVYCDRNAAATVDIGDLVFTKGNNTVDIVRAMKPHIGRMLFQLCASAKSYGRPLKLWLARGGRLDIGQSIEVYMILGSHA